MTAALQTPGPILGVVGGGQLGRMLAEAGAPLGVETVVLDPTPECPASPVAREQIVADFDDPDGVRLLAERADYLTFEIELADPDLLETIESEFDVPVHPSPDTLRVIQDKLVQNQFLAEKGIPVAPFRAVDDRADLDAALDDFGYPAMLKARTGGYDGRGNFPIESEADAEAALDAAPGSSVVEAFVHFEREVSVIGVKGDGEVATYPVGENVHEEEILRETVVPARTSEGVWERADEVAREVLAALEGRGVYGIELFETQTGDILVNEIAPRPHNSGHYTIEACLTSQFEQHVRAVTGRPLGATDLRCPAVVTNILGDVDEPETAALRGVDEVLAARGANLHWYGKREVRPLRKMGHVTLLDVDSVGSEMQRVEDGFAVGADNEPDDLLAQARDLRESLTFET